ncbi:hypothetical protein JCM15519_00530 [Fundidesulfovibrio butyratiphilus]
MAGKTVFVAGAFEFIADDKSEKPDPKAWEPLVKAFDKLGYSIGSLSPAEAEAIKSHGLTLTGDWLTLDAKDVRSSVVNTPGGQIGFVFFPVLKSAMDSPSEAMFERIEREAARLRSANVKLVVGVSPWGVQNEAQYLEKAKPVVDVLLGSGPGVGFSAKPADGGKVLWMHTFTKGKALYTVDVLDWPNGQATRWEQGKNYTTKVVVLDDSFTPDPAVAALFQGVPDPNEKHK